MLLQLMLDEILISPNLPKDFYLCQNAIIKMFELHKGLIIKNPFEYLINIDNGQIKDYDEHYESLLNHSKKIASGEYNTNFFKGKWFNDELKEKEDVAEIITC